MVYWKPNIKKPLVVDEKRHLVFGGITTHTCEFGLICWPLTGDEELISRPEDDGRFTPEVGVPPAWGGGKYELVL